MTQKKRFASCGCPGYRSTLPTRREMLKASANGFGLVALSALLGDWTSAGPPKQGAKNQGADAPRSPGGSPGQHFRPKAKNVIFCFMDGGVSHVDSFDPKPKLAELDGKPFTTSKNPTASGNRGRKRG